MTFWQGVEAIPKHLLILISIPVSVFRPLLESVRIFGNVLVSKRIKLPNIGIGEKFVLTTRTTSKTNL